MKNKRKAKTVFLIVLGLLFLACIGCTIIALEISSQAFSRVEEFPENEFYSLFRWKDIDQIAYSREEVRFNSNGKKLQGFIYGKENNNGLVVISQGSGSTADDYLPLIMYFVDQEWSVFAFNNTGVSGSEGESILGMTQSLVDLDSALIYIKNSNLFNSLPIMLVGHSWGGYAVCAILNYNHKINAVVSFAGYNKGSDVVNEKGLSSVGGIYHILTPQMWAIEKQLFGETANLTAIGGINKSNIPVMIVQCSNDDVIPANTISIYAHRRKITNPNVEVIYREGENATGHNYPYYSKRRKQYMESINTNDESMIDKTMANELDPDLMERINIMFNNAR